MGHHRRRRPQKRLLSLARTVDLRPENPGRLL